MTAQGKDFGVSRLHALNFFRPGELELHVLKCAVESMVQAHDHDFLEIALIAGGRGEHISSSRRVLTTAGDIWVLRPGCWHTYMSPRNLMVYNCLIGAGLFKDLTPLVQQESSMVELLWRGPATQAKDGCLLVRLNPNQRLAAQRILDTMIQMQEGRGGSGGRLAMLGQLWMLLSVLAGAIPERDGEGEARSATSPSPNDAGAGSDRLAGVLDAMEHLEATSPEHHSIEALSQRTGLSPSHLRRLFVRVTGQSPLQYLASVRIQRACRLLAETHTSITEIAGVVGWPDPNLFARRFKDHLGISPRGYRKKHQQLGAR